MKLKKNLLINICSFIIFTFLSLSIIISCQNEPEISGLRTVCFDTEILPLMQSSCATADCHGVAESGGYRLDSFEGIIEGIKSRDPNKSILYKTIISTGDDRMPPDTLLSIEERALIRVWIEQGAAKIICQEPVTDTLPYQWTNPFVCFERDILPIMQTSCGITECHDPYTQREEYNFTTYQGILRGVVPGKPTLSKIYKVITEDESSDIMPPPPYQPLSQGEIDSIYNWILAGAPDDYCGYYCDTFQIKYTTHLESIISTKCEKCHNTAVANGGVILEGYDDVVNAVNNGTFPAVLRVGSGYPRMPPEPVNPFPECEVRKFEIWVENGMPI